MRSGKVAVFAYGSLMIVESFSKAIGRPFDAQEFEPAILTGYRRTWRASAPIHSEALGREID